MEAADAAQNFLFRAPLRCARASQNRASTHHAKTARAGDPGLAGAAARGSPPRYAKRVLGPGSAAQGRILLHRILRSWRSGGSQGLLLAKSSQPDEPICFRFCSRSPISWKAPNAARIPSSFISSSSKPNAVRGRPKALPSSHVMYMA